MSYPTAIQNLIESFKKLPGIGEKTAERLALSTLDMDEDSLKLFGKSLKDVKEKVKKCSICHSFTDNVNGVCDICGDQNRDHKTICVVEEPKNVIMFEKMGSYNGTYHVLDGLISPLDGINPEDINISSLLSRIDKEKVKEVIIAVKPSIEGETTSLYISKKLEGKGIIVSKIANGVPLGADMDYIDTLTLETAIADRKKISD